LKALEKKEEEESAPPELNSKSVSGANQRREISFRDGIAYGYSAATDKTKEWASFLASHEEVSCGQRVRWETRT